MRIKFFTSAVAIAVGLVCAAGSASAATTLLVDGECVSVSDSDGCLFTGTINDDYFSTNLAGHPNSYLNAVNAYNAYVATHPWLVLLLP
jgi:hypothetical protein